MGAAAFLALFALLLATSNFPNQAHAQDSPSVAISLSPSGSVEPGTAITAAMSFGNLASDSDTSTTDYIFRADVVDADACEGGGMGKDRYFKKVDDDPEVRTATVSASCPAGDYTVRVSLSSAANEELASASADFTVAEPTPEPTPAPTPEPTPEPTPAPPAPPIEVDLSPASPVVPGNEVAVTMSFNGLEPDADTSTIDYTFRADVLDSEKEAADECEGNGLGADRNINRVDDDPEVRTGTISAGCPAGSYDLKVSIITPEKLGLALIFAFSIEEEPAVAGAAGDATGAPTISGTNLVGQTQTANKGTIADSDGVPAESTFTYQWIRVSGGSEDDISGATSKTYTPVAADQGKFLKVKVNFTDRAGHAESRTSSQSEVIGATTCTPAAPQDTIWSACLTVDSAGYSYEGEGHANNYGALSSTEFTVGGTTYTIDGLSTLNNTLFDTTVLRFTSDPGNAVSGWVLHIGSAEQFALRAATASTASTGGQGYNWYDTSLTWTTGDVISVWITANNEATGEPSISGTNLVGQTQTANKGSIADADGLPAESTFTYQWIHFLPRGTEFDITGANSKTYTTVAADAGHYLKVKVGFTDDAGNDESRTSAASEIIGYTSCTPAAPQDAIWSACLTPEHPGGSKAGYEFVSPTSTLNFGALSDTEFTVGGTTYTIDNLETLSNSMVLAFTSAPGNAASDWVLHIGSASTSFALSAATTYEGDTEYQWNSTGQNWINVPVRSVWLTAAAVSNNAPVFPSGTITRSVAENTASGQNVGAPVAATDTDTGDTLTYSLEGTDSGSFTIVSTSGQIRTSAALDHETKSSYSVTVKVNDGTVNATKAVTIRVTDVAEPPDQPAAPIVSAKSGTTDSLNVSWSAPANTGRPAIDDYNVRYRIGTTGSFTSHSFSGTGTSTTIGGLTADTEYQVQVQAHNDEGDSPWSASATARTNASTSAVSSDATLSALTLSPTDISNFQSGTLTYSVDVANSVGSVTVTPTANHASATITVNGATVASGSGRAVSVDVGSNTITIVVTAEDGNTTESYTVTVTRAASGAYDGTPQLAGANAAPWGIWGNADTLWVSDQADKKLYAYRRSDGSRVAARDIDIGGELTGASRRTYGIWSDGTRMWVADASAGALLAYGVSDGARQSGRDVALAEDANDYANDHEQPRGVGSDGTTLWVADLRTGALHDKLYAYGVSNGVRQSGREFDLAKSTEYANTNDNSNPAGVWTDGTTLWVADDYDAKIYAYAVSGGARVSEVSGGSTVYPKDVTLDGENETPAGIWSDGVRLWVVDRVVGKLYAYDLPGAVASDDVTLSALTLSGVTLSPSFASGTYGYTASVANSVESTTVTATPTHAGASREITPADADANAAGHQVNLTAGGDTVITAEVTAQDKMTTKTYRVTVTRAAAQPPQSDDATLSALSLSGVSLSPAFASRTITYTPSVANSVESTTVTATTNQASATVVIMPADADANTAGHQVNLGVGDTEITVEVTAEDGSAMKTYTVTVTRAPAGASSDATLRELTLSGVTLTQAFTPEVITYTANVDNSVSATTVKAVTTDARATRKILIGGVQDLDADVDLAVGDNTITVEVTAEDGVTTKTYTVTVTRAAPPAAAGVPNIVVAASKRVFNPADGSDDGGYQERDLIIALYNLESDATWSGDNYYGDPSTLDYVHRTDILDAGGSTALADLDNRNDCEGPALMSVDREIRKVNENPETRDGGVIDVGDCVNDFAVTVTVWEGAAFESQGRAAAPYVQLTCRFDGTANDDFRALPWGGEHEGPGWYYHEYVLCTDANGDLAPDSAPTIPALNWEPPEDS